MKTHHVFLFASLALSLCAPLSVRADESSYAAIVKERDSVLSQILAGRLSRRAVGLADEAAITAARIALYSFRRDVATATEEKIKKQTLIIEIFEGKLEDVKSKVVIGVAGSNDVLEAKLSYLEARQLLEELRLKKK